MPPPSLDSLYRELAYYSAFTTPEEVRITMLRLLSRFSIDDLDNAIVEWRFNRAIRDDQLLSLLQSRYLTRNPESSGILREIAVLEIEQFHSQRTDADQSSRRRWSSALLWDSSRLDVHPPENSTEWAAIEKIYGLNPDDVINIDYNQCPQALSALDKAASALLRDNIQDHTEAWARDRDALVALLRAGNYAGAETIRGTIFKEE
ncbi:uncharacterized protein N7496_012504 [Penicillium cataractarum]|uniref:Uncharacterized protein n=1 Tax=Penicillium cataractarum TaxID=2100454 RepID=A0A9W9R7R5_9EURO|nr:uncharacterized protein N7496_012504 [Penicillium cataractarum]KAJ5355292.1 hypothetical protein N7496_012504 [Penicillium cataractarum]